MVMLTIEEPVLIPVEPVAEPAGDATDRIRGLLSRYNIRWRPDKRAPMRRNHAALSFLSGVIGTILGLIGLMFLVVAIIAIPFLGLGVLFTAGIGIVLIGIAVIVAWRL